MVGRVAEAADAQAGDGEAVAIVVQAAQRLACGLAEAVERVRPGPRLRGDHRRPRREPDGVVAARVDDAVHPVADRGLEHAVGQADVTVDGSRDVGLGGDGGEVHHGIGAVHQTRQHAGIVGEVGDNDLVAGRHDVDAAHVMAGGREPVHQAPPDPPGSTGDHDADSPILARAGSVDAPERSCVP